MENLNRWIGTGNLTRNPELKTLDSGTKLCTMRVAVNSRVRIGGEWKDKANYIDIAVFGSQAEACSTYMTKGSPIAVDGRLDWSEWEDQQGNKRQAIKVIAQSVQFLPSGQRSDNGERDDAPPTSEAPADDDFGSFEPAPVGGDDDIPF